MTSTDVWGQKLEAQGTEAVPGQVPADRMTVHEVLGEQFPVKEQEHHCTPCAY